MDQLLNPFEPQTATQVSRTRYWGTPLPVWTNPDFSEIICIGSVEELERLSGRKVTDLHRHFIDDIEIPSQKGPGHPPLRRIEDVFDCWFESGSMPYAQLHYPFENKERFEKTFPADFIAEGLDQTRGWFYTLMVLSTALFGKPAFKNLICNGGCGRGRACVCVCVRVQESRPSNEISTNRVLRGWVWVRATPCYCERRKREDWVERCVFRSESECLAERRSGGATTQRQA